jgi:signal transduction histidine kinase
MNRLTRPSLRNLPLFWKLLVPFLILVVFLGVFGVATIVRDLGSRAETTLDEDLTRRSLEARAALRDRELYLLESGNFAANLSGIAESIGSGDGRRTADLLESVVALKGELNLLTATNREGIGIIEFSRPDPAGDVQLGRGTRWTGQAVVDKVLKGTTSDRASGFLTAGGKTLLAVAAPVCPVPSPCEPVGAAIAGIDATRLAAGALSSEGRSSQGVSIFDPQKGLLASNGIQAAEPPEGDGIGQPRRTHSSEGQEVASLYSPLVVGGRSIGTLAVTIPTSPAFSSVRGAAVGLIAVLLAAMAGVVGLGWLLSRSILRQVRPLVETNRELGSGKLSARAPVIGDDELGELAEGVNQMAEQLQASYETLELRVTERTEEVRRLLKERTEFFASLSHEFRTPLAVVLGQVEMMLDPSAEPLPRKTVDRINTIGDSAKQLLSLVNDVLDLARAEGGRIDINTEELHVADVVDDLRPTLEGLARAGGLRLSIDVPRDLPLVVADRRRLSEVIINLVDNGVKYTASSGRVAVAARPARGSVEVAVIDSGVGIPSKIGDLIFEPFYRVEGTFPQRGEASSGLGLALTKRLVEAQGGKIAFKSRRGAGTTFTFTLRTASSTNGGRTSRSPMKRVVNR